VGLAVCAAVLLIHATLAAALVTPPVVVDGPNSDGIVLGGVAMAPDGTGGLVYAKTVEGKPHVFAARFDGTNWSAPIRVDAELPFEASEPRIAAGNRGRLLVVWVAPVATLVKGEVRRGLYSASLGPGADEFGSALLVDPNVKTGVGTSPSLAGTVPGKAIVAYRVVTQSFNNPAEFTSAVQLRPGDVIADIRLARLEGDRWSRIGPINRNPAASMRPPTETNGPQVAIGATGRAAVAWQEPDSSGAARIWVRRVTGTTLGPIFPASPETFEGKPISDDASSIGLGVTPTDRVRVAARVDGSTGSPLHGQRVFLTTLGPSSSPSGAKPVGPELADGGGATAPPGPLGPPAVAVSDGSGGEGLLDLAFTSGTAVRSLSIDDKGKLQPPRSIGGAPAQPGGPVVATVDPEGGGVIAYEAIDESGSPTVVVRQEFPGGELQTGLLYGPLGGSVTELSGSAVASGDALLVFCQGESGQLAIVADHVSAPPASFGVEVPQKWVLPTRAKVSWQPPVSAVGGLTYGLVLDGRVIRSDLRRRRITPPAALLGSGVRKVRVIATDRLGGEVVSKSVKLRVDGQPPVLRYRVSGKGEVVLRLKDSQSGLNRKSVRASFGDGAGARAEATIHHRFAKAGRYTIRVRARDRVGNRLAQKIEVNVR
jgi:hypothetical protein